LSGQAQPVDVAFFERHASNQVHYAGPQILLQLLAGGVADLVVFELVWTVTAVFLQTAFGIGVALMLNRAGVRFKGWWRTLFILPWAIPEFVGALVWSRIFEPTTGSLSVICGCPLEWGRSQEQTLLVLLIGATWMGWPLIMLAATAGLKLIPPEVYDSAALDGAGRLSLFRSITWPLLLPLLAPAIIIRCISAFNQFYLFVVMQAQFPNLTFATLSYYVFGSFGGGLFAVSAAINVFAVAMLILFILMFNRWTRGEAAEGVTYA
jgi:arabinogalactan oligomer/maltooligosaccharide transport system permease protein